MAFPSLDELALLHTHICRAVGDPRRIQIIYALGDCACNVTTLADRLDMPQSTVSRHLAILRQSALVETQREGASVVYSLADPRIITLLDNMREMLRDVVERQTTALE